MSDVIGGAISKGVFLVIAVFIIHCLCQVDVTGIFHWRGSNQKGAREKANKGKQYAGRVHYRK
jgi:hypothetical protein